MLPMSNLNGPHFLMQTIYQPKLLERRDGFLCIAGTRMPFARLLEELGAGATISQFSDRYGIPLETVHEVLHEFSRFLNRKMVREIPVANTAVTIEIPLSLVSELNRLVLTAPAAHDPPTHQCDQKRSFNHFNHSTKEVLWAKD